MCFVYAYRTYSCIIEQNGEKKQAFRKQSRKIDMTYVTLGAPIFIPVLFTNSISFTAHTCVNDELFFRNVSDFVYSTQHQTGSVDDFHIA